MQGRQPGVRHRPDDGLGPAISRQATRQVPCDGWFLCRAAGGAMAPGLWARGSEAPGAWELRSPRAAYRVS